jgi:hypothetical protein
MADVNINLFKKIEENTTSTDGFVDGYLIASIGGKVRGVNPSIFGGGGAYYQVIDDEDNSGSAPYVTKTRAVENMKISGVASLNGEAVATVTVNGVPYVYDDPITQGDVIEFTHKTNGVTRFKIEAI